MDIRVIEKNNNKPFPTTLMQIVSYPYQKIVKNGVVILPKIVYTFFSNFKKNDKMKLFFDIKDEKRIAVIYAVETLFVLPILREKDTFLEYVGDVDINRKIIKKYRRDNPIFVSLPSRELRDGIVDMFFVYFEYDEKEYGGVYVYKNYEVRKWKK